MSGTAFFSLLAALVVGFALLIVWAVTDISEFQDRCESQGGVAVITRGDDVCIVSDAVIEVR